MCLYSHQYSNSLLLPVLLFRDVRICNGTNKSVAAINSVLFCKVICPLLYLKQARQVEKVTSCKVVRGRDHCCCRDSSDPNMQEGLCGPAGPSCTSSTEMVTGIVEAVGDSEEPFQSEWEQDKAAQESQP